MKISVALLSSYLYCSRKLFLEQVLKLKEPPKESLALGTIRHQIYDHINKKEKEIAVSITKKESLESIQNLYRQQYLGILREAILRNKKSINGLNLNILGIYKKIFPYVEEECLMRASNIFSFMESNNVFGEELWEKLTPKIMSEMKVDSEKLRLKGVIDQVYAYESCHVPFELKTGSAPSAGVWPSHRIQVVAYSLLLEEKFGRQIKEGFVFYLDSKEKRRIAINPFMKDEVTQITDKVVSILEGKELPDFCVNKNKCKSCGIRQSCYNENEISGLLSVIKSFT